MKEGEKYEIEVEEIITDSTGKKFAKIKGFNSLIFDEEGLKRLRLAATRGHSYESFSRGYNRGTIVGMQKAWSLAQRIAETPASELMSMGLRIEMTNQPLTEYSISCSIILSNTVENVKRKFKIFDKHHR